jgi:hypothetical protein
MQNENLCTCFVCIQVLLCVELAMLKDVLERISVPGILFIELHAPFLQAGFDGMIMPVQLCRLLGLFYSHLQVIRCAFCIVRLRRQQGGLV